MPDTPSNIERLERMIVMVADLVRELDAGRAALQRLADQIVAGVLRVEALYILNPQGDPVIKLGCNADGDAQLALCDRHGLATVVMDAGGISGGRLSIADASLDVAAVLRAVDGRGELLLMEGGETRCLRACD